MKTAFEQSRRDFLKTTALAGGGLIVGFTLPAASRLAMAAGDFRPNAFLRIDSAGDITIICAQSEMGQGVLTALPMLAADELDVDWSRVSVQQAGADKAYVNPVFGFQGTGGSTSIKGFWEPMRKAGAAAREMLVAAAAARWGLTPGACRTEAGYVLGAGGHKASYGDLADAAGALPVPAKPRLKDPKDFRIIGKPLRRLDSPPKVDGSGTFGLDIRLPGMLTAVMARPPVPGAKLVSVDDSKARAVPGVHDVIRLPQGVAVLADGYWPAERGREALVLNWDKGRFAAVSTDSISKGLHAALDRKGAVARSDGDADAKAARSIEATYEAPYLAHACMEPMNCTAWVKPDSAEIWAGTQSQGIHQGIVAGLTGLSPDRVRINTTYLGGGFGRRFAPDFIIASTLLSKASGKPVKLVYSREDDMRALYYRPASVARFKAGFDASGKPVSFQAGVATQALSIAAGFAKELKDGIDDEAVEGIKQFPYALPNVRVEYMREEPGYQVWFWRSVGCSQNGFFREAFVDEMATAAGKDPYEFRRSLLAAHPRQLGVLELAAAKAGWGKPLPAGVYRGIAVVESFGSYVAEVAEVSVADDGTPRVHRIVAAVDCGRIVNPQIVHRQVESAIVYGLSAAFYGRIDVKDGEVVQGNFDTYPVLRMAGMPKVEVHIVPSTEHPSGIGEPGLPPAAPAVCNAIFAATGKRIRKLPIDTGLLKRA